jgi:hypothetical protein
MNLAEGAGIFSCTKPLHRAKIIDVLPGCDGVIIAPAQDNEIVPVMDDYRLTCCGVVWCTKWIFGRRSPQRLQTTPGLMKLEPTKWLMFSGRRLDSKDTAR